MTANLVNACQEIDDQLLECLLTWSEAADQGRESGQSAVVHAHYGQRSSCLIEARSAIEAALRALEGVPKATGRAAHDPGPENRIAREHGTAAHVSHESESVEVIWSSGDFEGSSSRPDRPQRPRQRCRGLVRDWNRDILACRTARKESGVHECSTHRERDVSSAASEEIRYAGGDAAEAEINQEDEDFVREPDNGTQSKSNRSRKRG